MLQCHAQSLSCHRGLSLVSFSQVQPQSGYLLTPNKYSEASACSSLLTSSFISFRCKVACHCVVLPWTRLGAWSFETWAAPTSLRAESTATTHWARSTAGSAVTGLGSLRYRYPDRNHQNKQKQVKKVWKSVIISCHLFPGLKLFPVIKLRKLEKNKWF